MTSRRRSAQGAKRACEERGGGTGEGKGWGERETARRISRRTSARTRRDHAMREYMTESKPCTNAKPLVCRGVECQLGVSGDDSNSNSNSNSIVIIIIIIIDINKIQMPAGCR